MKIVRPHECGNFWNCTFFTRIGFRSTPNQWNLSSRPHHFETDLQNGFKARSTRIRRRIPVGGAWIEDELRASLTKIEHSRRGFRRQTDNCHISTATMSFRWYNNSRAPKVEFTDSSVKWMSIFGVNLVRPQLRLRWIWLNFSPILVALWQTVICTSAENVIVRPCFPVYCCDRLDRWTISSDCRDHWEPVIIWSQRLFGVGD